MSPPNGPEFRWRVLRAGGFRLDGGGMFGIIPKAMWSRWVTADADNRIPLAMNCVLLERDDASVRGRPMRVLVETGAGEGAIITFRGYRRRGGCGAGRSGGSRARGIAR